MISLIHSQGLNASELDFKCNNDINDKMKLLPVPFSLRLLIA